MESVTMKYIVNTTWKHENEIDWNKMDEAMAALRREGQPSEEVYWYEIDSHTHGAVSIFPSEESYKSHIAKLTEMRNTSSKNMKIQMDLEVHGPALVTLTASE